MLGRVVVRGFAPAPLDPEVERASEPIGITRPPSPALLSELAEQTPLRRLSQPQPLAQAERLDLP